MGTAIPLEGATKQAEHFDSGGVLSLAQAVERSTFSDRTLRSAISDGELVAYRRGRRIIIWERDLIRWLRGFDKVTVTR
ncbi:Uncharacterised protein [Mycobacteroides abscessus subsp. abscessus]|uniref:helix-turn-helix domain-containing protein n=1 Tax=Mycobacteroides abscessus TaxID=36809 RepID=UPI0009261D5D|nr:helix-turn-helix domain-containing protein [Mycobacteroides abscessus]SII74986.1 Uncharacterised protein [Mycobacteroides abscessus subsp. abscessus]SIJ49029.1 Uncharacterised protein [Mycobacteroides abscessus subsp. abscessus]SIM00984.1 Uncharacterised protein [Mycobacteroides abscessus subsp. abscessus]SLL03964.1 Uncharacterised protein [Mycobacteroides abscessus subsp. abscessus]